MSHVSTLLAGIGGLITGAGLAVNRTAPAVYSAADTALAYKNLPPDPDRVVVLTAYGANGDQPAVTLGNQPVQIKFRGLAGDALDVDVLGDAAFDLLHGATNLTFGNLHVVQILRTSSIPLGMDEQSRRWMRSDNYSIDVDYPTTANRPT